MSLLILKLRTEHQYPNIASSLLCGKVKQSINLYICLTALSKVVLIKLGHVETQVFIHQAVLIMPANLNSVFDRLILGFLHLSPDKCSSHIPGRCFPCISLLEILVLFLIISLFLTSWKALENTLASLVTIWHERGRAMQCPHHRSVSLTLFNLWTLMSRPLRLETSHPSGVITRWLHCFIYTEREGGRTALCFPSQLV